MQIYLIILLYGHYFLDIQYGWKGPSETPDLPKFRIHIPFVRYSNQMQWLYIVSRLGSGEGDANELMAAPFFSGIAWNLLEKKRLTPPFKPQVSNCKKSWENMLHYSLTSRVSDPGRDRLFKWGRIRFPKYRQIRFDFQNLVRSVSGLNIKDKISSKIELFLQYLLSKVIIQY